MKTLTKKDVQEMRDRFSHILNVSQNPYVTQSYIMTLLDHLDELIGKDDD